MEVTIRYKEGHNLARGDEALGGSEAPSFCIGEIEPELHKVSYLLNQS